MVEINQHTILMLSQLLDKYKQLSKNSTKTISDFSQEVVNDLNKLKETMLKE